MVERQHTRLELFNCPLPTQHLVEYLIESILFSIASYYLLCLLFCLDKLRMFKWWVITQSLTSMTLALFKVVDEIFISWLKLAGMDFQSTIQIGAITGCSGLVFAWKFQKTRRYTWLDLVAHILYCLVDESAQIFRAIDTFDLRDLWLILLRLISSLFPLVVIYVIFFHIVLIIFLLVLELENRISVSNICDDF